MKRTLGFLVLLGVVLMPTAQAFAMTQADLYQSYAIAHAGTALETGVGLDTSVNSDTSVQVGEDIGVDVNADANASVDTDSSVDTNSDATSEEGATFQFERSNISSDISVTSADMVTSQADLEAFASSEMQDDESIERAEFSNTSVSLWYKHPAKFLGFIPMDMTVEATTDASGTVTVDYPWYSFLFSAADKAEVKAAIEERLGANINAETSNTFSIRSQAQVLADMRAALSASAE